MGERFSTKKDEIKKDVLQQISPKEWINETINRN
jgi:hypothetical protein